MPNNELSAIDELKAFELEETRDREIKRLKERANEQKGEGLQKSEAKSEESGDKASENAKDAAKYLAVSFALIMLSTIVGGPLAFLVTPLIIGAVISGGAGLFKAGATAYQAQKMFDADENIDRTKKDIDTDRDTGIASITRRFELQQRVNEESPAVKEAKERKPNDDGAPQISQADMIAAAVEAGILKALKTKPEEEKSLG